MRRPGIHEALTMRRVAAGLASALPGTLGGLLRARDAERDSPVARHDVVIRNNLAALLTRSDHFDQRATATQGDFPSRVSGRLPFLPNWEG